MRQRQFVAAIILAGTVPLALAQNQQQRAPGKPAAASPSTTETKDARGSSRIGKSSAEMQKLKFMFGNWTTAEKFEASEFVPQAGTGTGKAEMHAGPGGLSIVENYHSKNGPVGPFSGHALIWWDAKSGTYKSFWCDSMTACESSFGVGKWEGDKLVFTGESEYNGRKVSMRSTFSAIKPDSFTWTEETSIDGGPMKPSMTIQYTRAAAAPRKPDPKM